ncbi:MAG TPA: actin-binding WH2 domain-containing protein [Acidobacteriota bacterium]|nr:actin-binding WH2 domain-containing protein [Acidobacteriota bacterium]
MTESPAAPVTSPASPSWLGAYLTQILSDRDRFFDEVVEGVGLRGKLTTALWTLIGLSAIYGAAAGAYAGPAQALSAALKLPFLFLGTLAICFPGFFVIQVLVGSRLRLSQVLALVLGALSLSAILLAAVVPITAFFLFTGANYYFLTLLHVLIVLGAGLLGMSALHDGLAFACEKRGVYPKKAMTIMKVWAVLFAFVGIQMAWNLQPFVGDRGEPFELFRHNEGNFYTAVVYSVGKLTEGDKAMSPRGPFETRSPDAGNETGVRAPSWYDSTRVPTR